METHKQKIELINFKNIGDHSVFFFEKKYTTIQIFTTSKNDNSDKKRTNNDMNKMIYRGTQ